MELKTKINRGLTYASLLPSYIYYLITEDTDYFNIPTHLSTREKILLYKLASSLTPKSKIVEIGSYVGASSVFLACGAKKNNSKLYCIDTWQNEAMTEGERDTFHEFKQNTKNIRKWIIPFRGKSTDVVKEFTEKIDLLFIDGDHSYTAVLQDAKSWFPKLKDTAIIVFHDFAAPDVKKAINEFEEQYQIKKGSSLPNIYWTKINSKIKSIP